MARLLLIVLVGLAAGPALAQEKMNVLFVCVDDLNNDLGCYGHPLVRSPNIDKLATKGVWFDRAYCQYPLCNPSRASFMTGLRPDTTRVYDNATRFRETRPETVTLPQTFRKAGYFAARVGKLYHYGVPAQIGTDGLDDPESWDKVVNPRGRDKDDEEADLIFTINPNAKGSSRYGGSLSWHASDGEDHTHTDGIAAIETVKLIEQNKDKPFFIACGFYRPHTPFVAPKKYFGLYPTDKIELPTVPDYHWDKLPKAAYGSFKPEQERLTDKLRLEAIQAYFACTTFMDAQLGIILDQLEKLDLADKTIVVFFTDHGYHLGEHGLWQKQSIFENSARVPLIIYDPRAKGNGKAAGRTVELIDLHATLAELCGIAPPDDLDGKSLVPLLKDPQAEWNRPAVTQVRRGGGKKGPSFFGYAVRNERYRYIEWDGGKEGAQLYDYENDPNEWKNLADDPEYAPVIAELKKAIPTKK